MAALALLLLLPVCALAAEAGPARRITDLQISPVPNILSVSNPVRLGDSLYFLGSSTMESGLFRSVEGSRRSRLVKALSAQDLLVHRGRLFFLGPGALWTSDGTAEGTIPVAAFGEAGGHLTSVGGFLYFLGRGSVLWRSDGSLTGTFPLPVIGTNGLARAEFVELGGRVYFFGAEAEGEGFDLWQTSGTAGTTRRVSALGPALPPDEIPAFEYGLSRVGERLVFWSRGPSPAYVLWTSNGTEAGTVPVREFVGDFGAICPGACFPAGPSPVTSLGSTGLFFANDGEHGRELWRTDGTAAGTRLVKDIAPGSAASIWAGTFSVPGFLSGPGAPFQLFAADDGVHGNELWRTDGTTGGTFLIGEFHPAAEVYDPHFFVASGGSVFFQMSGELWVGDGTFSGTRRFEGLRGYPVLLDDGLAVIGPDGLWVGDASGFDLVDDLRRPRGLDPRSLSPVPGGIVFTPSGSQRLWKSDGVSAAGIPTEPFRELGPLSPAGGKVFFVPDVRNLPRGPWVTDGTTDGTRPLRHSEDGLGPSPERFTSAGRNLFFGIGSELWATDGTEGGTRLVRNLNPNPDGSVLVDFASFRGVLYVAAFNDSDPALWRSDGTEAGTFRIANLPVSRLAAATNKLFFVAPYDLDGSGLWVTDGSASGTARLGVLGPDMLTPAGNRLFFLAYPPGGPVQLGVSDGSPPGTRTVLEPASIEWIVADGERVFFSAHDPAHGQELWTSDGTAAGTRLVRDIVEGPTGSWPWAALSAGSLLVFSAEDPDHGRELWRSDGTEEGTGLLQDLAPGPASSSPDQLQVSGSLVYFRASDVETGSQLWALPFEALAAPGPRRGSPRILSRD